jgi:RNA polymerase sigma-70 factor (ECF subfamily)
MNWIEAVYRREYRGLFLLALSITASHQQAEDAVHEAISRACRQRRPPVGDHAAYVYRAVRNAAIDERRRGGVRQAGPFDEASHPPPGSADAHDTIVVAELQRGVQAAIETLPEDLREVVVLRVANDLSFRQIADVLNEPTMTVSDRYHRALKVLRSSLEHLA